MKQKGASTFIGNSKFGITESNAKILQTPEQYENVWTSESSTAAIAGFLGSPAQPIIWQPPFNIVITKVIQTLILLRAAGQRTFIANSLNINFNDVGGQGQPQGIVLDPASTDNNTGGYQCDFPAEVTEFDFKKGVILKAGMPYVLTLFGYTDVAFAVGDSITWHTTIFYKPA